MPRELRGIFFQFQEISVVSIRLRLLNHRNSYFNETSVNSMCALRTV